MFYAWCLGLKMDETNPLTLPHLKQQGHIQKKTKSYEPKALNETMLPMRRKKTITISHTQYRTTPIPTPISTKEKEWGREKKMDTHTGSKKL